MKMKRRWGMAIDLDKCTGCGTCAIACSQENNMPVFEDDSDLPKRVQFLDLMKVTNDRDAKYPNVEVCYIPKMCQQCEGNDPKNPKPPCVSVCPVVATDVGDDGVVSQVWSRCIGCRYCQASCPYEARAFNWWKPRYDGSFENSLNTDVSVASRGTIVKCQFCTHIWKRERDKAVAKGELDINAVTYTPACVASCPTKAMVFGDLDDPNSEISQLLEKEKKRKFRLVHTIDDKDEKTKEKMMHIKQFPNPKVYYLTSKAWIKEMMKFK
jgi:molybdopterin-containing oxidoreductase family iron-sulfur binding subunit